MRELTFHETKIIHSRADYEIDGHYLPYFPLVYNETEGLVTPIILFLLERTIRYAVRWRTAEKNSYLFAEWYDFLRLRGISLFEADEHHLKAFLLGGGQRYCNVIPHPKAKLKFNITKTSAEKLRLILLFYTYWESGRGVTLRTFRGSTLGSLTKALFEEKHSQISTTAARYAKSDENKGRRKRTAPNPDKVAMVLDTAASRGTSDTREKYYLIASLMAYAGFRAGGCSSISVDALFAAMLEEDAFRRLPAHRQILSKNHLPENQRIIISTLQQMSKDKRKFLFCSIEEKTGYRHAPVPINLLIEILDYLWTTRREFVEKRFLKRGKPTPPHVFLSNKNSALSQEAISNRLGMIFEDSHVGGSGHLLRHAFAQAVVRDLYLKDRALNGRAWQANVVLETARQMLGHKSVETIKPYLETVEGEELTLQGEPIVVLEKDDAAKMRAIAESLEGEQGDVVRARLATMMLELDMDPIYEPWREYEVI